METIDLKRALGLLLLYIFLILMASCGTVVYTSRSGNPPPPWFYSNRIEVVRYVYFPDYRIYYDFTTRTYIYFEGNIWVRNQTLPPRYRNLNLNRSRYQRIKGYRDDNIGRYHDQYRKNSGRSNRNYPSRG